MSFSEDKKLSASNSLEYSRRMEKNKLAAQNKSIQEIFHQNQNLKNKLQTVKSTINTNKQNYSFYEHRKRSQMLSRFVKEGEGKAQIKAEKNIRRRIKMYLKVEEGRKKDSGEKGEKIKLERLEIK